MNTVLTRFHSGRLDAQIGTGYASSMEKKPKCKCWKTKLPLSGRVVVRCEKHRGKPSKSGRLVCYFDEDGIVRREPGSPEEQWRELGSTRGAR